MEEARSLYPSQQLGGTIAATVAKETTDTNAPLEAGSRIDERLGTSWNDAIAFILNIFILVLEIQINLL